ncbi:hypothetical protein [Teredinibacter turnerae]|uniref:hypothetical protein n=1 Tax=Teredinibacter turnerae TaxID=2426 RepID=UPI000AD51026|nr:hypothetical protein [Teredinibacter turnerae]
MNIEVWIAFASAVLVFCIIPGSTVLLVMSQALSHGKKSVFPLVAGVRAGDLYERAPPKLQFTMA